MLPPYKASKMAAFLVKSDLPMWQDRGQGSLAQIVVSVGGGARGAVGTAAVVSAVVTLVRQAMSLWSHLPAAGEVFAPLLTNVSL